MGLGLPHLRHRLLLSGAQLDPTAPLSPLEEPALMLPNRIHTIDQGDSKIEDAQMVTAFMSAMLPHLEEIIAWGDNINASTLASYSVEKVKMFRAC